MVRSRRMQSCQWIFKLLTVCGCRRPSSWTSPYKKFLYAVYAVLLLVTLYTVVFLQVMDLILNVETQDELCDNIYMMLTMMVSCFKMYNMLTNRQTIADLIKLLENKPFRPENAKETEIRNNHDKRAGLQTFVYTIVVEGSVMLYTFMGVLKGDDNKLLYRMWLFYNNRSPIPLVFTYVQQIIALVIGSLIHIACDCFIWFLLIHTYSQIEILECRLEAIEQKGNQSAKSSASYHERVYRFARMVNKQIEMVIFVQFTASTLVVCFNLYLVITSKSSNSKVLILVMYSCCMLIQIFFYCWYGNEVKLKSLQLSDTIFGTDWTLINEGDKRILSLIMRRSTVPIEFTSMHVVSMNIETFINLLKTSYSAYNLLQQSQ